MKILFSFSINLFIMTCRKREKSFGLSVQFKNNNKNQTKLHFELTLRQIKKFDHNQNGTKIKTKTKLIL